MKNYSTKESLGYWISRSARKVDTYFENQLKEYGFTPNEYAILNSIHNNEARKPSDLAHFLNMDKGYIARQLTRLEEKGYIRRDEDKEDRRSQAIEVTTEGEEIIFKLVSGSIKTNRKISSVLNRQERHTLLAILKKLGNSTF